MNLVKESQFDTFQMNDMDPQGTGNIQMTSQDHMSRNENTYIQPKLDVSNLGIDLLLNNNAKRHSGSEKSFEIHETSQKQDDDQSNLFESDDDDDDDDDDSDDQEINNEQNNNSPTKNTYFQSQVVYRSPEDIENEKKGYLYQFERMEKKGFHVPKKNVPNRFGS